MKTSSDGKLFTTHYPILRRMADGCPCDLPTHYRAYRWRFSRGEFVRDIYSRYLTTVVGPIVYFQLPEIARNVSGLADRTIEINPSREQVHSRCIRYPSPAIIVGINAHCGLPYNNLHGYTYKNRILIASAADVRTHKYILSADIFLRG